MGDIPKEALAKGDDPWPGNPAFTRKEAGKAALAGPMTAEMAELAAAATELGVRPEEAFRRLGFSAKGAKRAARHELFKMAFLRRCEEHGYTGGLLAKQMVEGLQAQYVEVAKFEGQIMDEKAFADHPTRLHYADRFLELEGLRSPQGRREGSDEGDARPILNVQAGGNIQLIYFGEAKDAPDSPGHPK